MSERDGSEVLREQLCRAMALWHPSAGEVRRFKGRLQATVGKVKADRLPLTLVVQTGSAVAEAPSSFEAAAHLMVLELYARISGNDRLLRYSRLLRDVFEILSRARREETAAVPAAPARSLANLRAAGRAMGAVAAIDRDEPWALDERLLAFGRRGPVEAGIAGAALEMAAELRGELLN